MLDRLESESFLGLLGARAACCEEAGKLGLERQRVRDDVVIRTISRGFRLKDVVDDKFDSFWAGEASDEAAAEGVQ